jgi:hypothetical protein
MQRLYRATASSTALSAKPSGQPNTVQSSTLGQRRYGSGNGGMVAEHGGRVDGVRQRRGHLARWWFSAGDGGGTIKVRVLVFQGRRRGAPPIEVSRVGRWETGDGLAARWW